MKQYVLKHSTQEEEEMKVLTTISAEEIEGEVIYDFIHETPRVGQNYYQVLVQYEDGTTNYQLTGQLEFKENQAQILVAPNPASDYLKVDLSSYLGNEVSYSISNMQGEVIKSGEYGADHQSAVEIDLDNFQNGLYIIRVKAEKYRAVATRFMVAKDY